MYVTSQYVYDVTIHICHHYLINDVFFRAAPRVHLIQHTLKLRKQKPAFWWRPFEIPHCWFVADNLHVLPKEQEKASLHAEEKVQWLDAEFDQSNESWSLIGPTRCQSQPKVRRWLVFVVVQVASKTRGCTPVKQLVGWLVCRFGWNNGNKQKRICNLSLTIHND